MEAVSRKSCLLRLRPFRRLRRQTCDVSSAKPSPIGLYWNNKEGPPTGDQPMSTVYTEPLPPPSRCHSVRSHHQSEAAAGVVMEENQQNQRNQQNQQNPEDTADDLMDLDDDIDPETGERAQQ